MVALFEPLDTLNVFIVFPSSFVELLREQPEVTVLHPIEEAFVPIIKMNFKGIQIDLAFARLDLSVVSDDLSLSDTMLLKNLDKKCVLSLMGCRVADEILNQVPKQMFVSSIL